jgi:hypothetical protein
VLFITFQIKFICLSCLLHHRSCTSPSTFGLLHHFLLNTYCPFFKWLASCSRSGAMPLVSPHSATNCRLSVSNDSATHTNLKTVLDICDNSGLNSSSKPIILCLPTSAFWQSVPPCYIYVRSSFRRFTEFSSIFYRNFYCEQRNERGGKVEALCYKPKGRRFDSRWWAALWPWG